ncbi:putative thiamine transporter SLC35F3 isoform X3 [Schistocerca serialis cubense]|uniref:putative thiamine transporter SLC35F3 isoform X3 n=1 Tax=Schistocerca serialis cubense TaxID=2023355 RepID=UPI00214E2D02|nr:putative thiamine transporter SLC35F3 isoform X3 [Schistocerca serialis cubense]
MRGCAGGGHGGGSSGGGGGDGQQQQQQQGQDAVQGQPELATIFQPARRPGSGVQRAPSVVVTHGDDTPPRPASGTGSVGQLPNGPFSSVHQHQHAPQLQHADSVTGSTHQEQQQQPGAAAGKLRACNNSCCSQSARKIYCGVCVTVCVTASWVGATHCIKYLFLGQPPPPFGYGPPNISAVQQLVAPHQIIPYDAPFFTTWFCTNWTVLFFPLYFVCRVSAMKCKSAGSILQESVRNFRDKGFTAARFLTRCSFFCLLWVATNYMYIHSLRILLATDVMALFATNVSCVYLLSWVILHEQFVGVRIVAVILCDTGIALLAYMDGITKSRTLGGVVLAACAAAGSAVYKVLFKKVIGEASYGQVSLFFSLIGMFNAALLWPVCLTLYFTGTEILHWRQLPWPALLGASGLSLVANLLGNFSVALTYDLFITLGLITAVPVSAALDVVLYGAHFAGMKLAGMILISVGFFLVMFPDNWPDYITRLLRCCKQWSSICSLHGPNQRWSRRHRHGAGAAGRRDVIDYRTGYIRSHLRSPSGRVR